MASGVKAEKSKEDTETRISRGFGAFHALIPTEISSTDNTLVVIKALGDVSPNGKPQDVEFAGCGVSRKLDKVCEDLCKQGEDFTKAESALKAFEGEKVELSYSNGRSVAEDKLHIVPIPERRTVIVTTGANAPRVMRKLATLGLASA